MKIYLSKYWIAGHISLVCVEVVVVVATAALCNQKQYAFLIMLK